MVQTDRIVNAGVKPKLLIVTGATAVGKSEMAVRLGEAFGAEIVGADAMQTMRITQSLPGFIHLYLENKAL